MYARLTFIEIDPKDIKEVSAVYNAEIAPAVKEFKGISDVLLLEPTDSSGQLVSITTWKSKADADEYENSGTYRTLVDKLKEKYISKPVLKTYNTSETNVPVM
jgi:heme-degrading monooxygenase HmoA